MPWEIITLLEVDIWINSLNEKDKKSIKSAISELMRVGPALGRPLVDLIKNSEISNLKELRPLGGNIRILFVFDVRRNAILLVGGDKTNNWSNWYRKNIPVAVKRYHVYLELRKKEEGL